MNQPFAQGTPYDLVLIDGGRWLITAGDREAARVVSRLADAMQLQAVDPSASHAEGSHLLVSTEGHGPEDDGVRLCVLPKLARGDGQYLQLLQLSSVFARDAQTRGGVLLHGALATNDRMGVILAAPGGTGKTTASGRLPAPWRSLCDDNTLVVRDPLGDYWAHPWPTWSHFLQGEPGGTWNVRDAVPLTGIFFLSQALHDRAEPVGPGHAVCLLVECAEQASHTMARDLSREDRRSVHLERFDNLCALARAVPAHVLCISLTGPFWREIEQMLGNDLS